METTCGSLLRELEDIWREMGERKEDRHQMLLELERECLQVYQKKVNECSKSRAQLCHSLAVKEAELAALMASLGEHNLQLQVLGAAMICQSWRYCYGLYTGDYNMTPDRHLGAAQIDCLLLDVLITDPPFDRSYTNAPGPCVLFATPGMISGGFSLEVFKQWAPSEMNLITLPGYCIAGTIGHKLMSGKPTRIDLDKDTQIDVRCQIDQLSFSPHTDAKGIMDLVGFMSPRNVILVHGEKPRMEILKERIQTELGIKCYVPANKETVIIPTSRIVKTDATKAFIRSCSAFDFDVLCNSLATLRDPNGKNMEHVQTVRAKKAVEGILMMDRTKKPKIICEKELMLKLDTEEHKLRFAYCCPVCVGTS